MSVGSPRRTDRALVRPDRLAWRGPSLATLELPRFRIGPSRACAAPARPQLPSWCMRLLAGLLAVACLAVRSEAAPPPQWGALAPGPHAVGYRTIHVVDQDRRYFDVVRPLQIYLWYPAAVGAAHRMPYEGYFADAALDWGAAPERISYLRRHTREGFRAGALNPSFPGALTDEAFDSILRTPTHVGREAQPSAGRFPVLLHAHMQGALHQSVMLEYLASHGYVVLSVSTYNSSPAFYGRGDDTAEALLNLTEDFALMLAEARKLPFADSTRSAAVGMLAQAGLALQMKSAPLAAIACVECLGYGDALQRLPFFDPRAVRVPVLELISSSHEDSTTGQASSYVDRFTSATRYVGRFSGVAHSDFYPFPRIADPATPHERHDAILLTTRRFLDAVLKGDGAGRAFVDRSGPIAGMPADFLRIRISPPERAMPTEAEFLAWLRYGEMTRAAEAWERFGPALASRSRMFTTVLFLARDNEPHADEAVRMFRAGFPAGRDASTARQDELLSRVLEQRPR